MAKVTVPRPDVPHQARHHDRDKLVAIAQTKFPDGGRHLGSALLAHPPEVGVLKRLANSSIGQLPTLLLIQQGAVTLESSVFATVQAVWTVTIGGETGTSFAVKPLVNTKTTWRIELWKLHGSMLWPPLLHGVLQRLRRA